ncbi:MAG: nucleotidyltransferase domain-containing protein [bacterium]|nr:nucleotidyltransferase domain-containing protein [bacterium]
MNDGIDILPRHRYLLERLIHEHLPEVEVWAYGSRVNGKSHGGSDLDLVLRGPKLSPLDIDRLIDFYEAVDASTIPFLVEARDWTRIPDSFHESILQNYIVLTRGDSKSRATSNSSSEDHIREVFGSRLGTE